MFRLKVVFLVICLFTASIAPADGGSFFAVQGKWKTAREKAFTLRSLSGKKTVVALFYTSCRSICPMTVENLLKLERRALGRGATPPQFLLVSIDERRDTSARLREFAEQHHLGPQKPNWHLLAGDERQVRELAGLVGLGFSEPPASESLHQMHSLQFTVLDGEGRVLGAFKSLEPDLEAAAALLN